MNGLIEGALARGGLQLSVEGGRQLDRLAQWLRGEAIPAGGLGPAEGEIIESRHLGDSLIFAAAWDRPPEICWDLGSGVGLPGLALAIVWPTTHMVLIDRSGKRCDLARRAARVVGLEIEVRQADLATLIGPVEAIVSRATMPAAELRPLLVRLLKPGGMAVVSGGSEMVSGYERMDVPPGVFDQTSRHLIMRAP